MQTKPQKQHRQLMVSKCSARECRDAARHHVKRRWLLKIKAGLQKQVSVPSFCTVVFNINYQSILIQVPFSTYRWTLIGNRVNTRPCRSASAIIQKSNDSWPVRCANVG